MAIKPCNFFYNVTGEESERLLKEYGTDGDFLARPSESQPSNFTLSIRRGDAVTHVKITCDEERNLEVYNASDQKFEGLPDLIEHYQQNPDKLHLRNQNGEAMPLHLNKPLSVPIYEEASLDVRKPAAQPYFHSGINGQEAKELLKNEKVGTFLIRDSQRTPGGYVISAKDADEAVVHIIVHRNLRTNICGVASGDEFMNLDELIKHYSTSPMVSESNQRVVYLNQYYRNTAVPADAIDLRIAQLEKRDPQSHENLFSVEFEGIINNDELYSRREGRRDYNAAKNRYKNIVPYDHTRVVLTEKSDTADKTENDYINGNYITIKPGSPIIPLAFTKQFISTQGCTDSTVVDFWRMMWQVNSRVIIMATRENEGGRPKCHIYWPGVNKEVSFRGYRVRNEGETRVKDATKSDLYIRRKLVLYKENGNGVKRDIIHFQFVAWPDHGCPEEPSEVLDFLEAAEKAHQEMGADQGPIVVHCSAGIGRTGALITIDTIINQMRTLGFTCQIDIPRTLMYLRDQRNGFVQTASQYEFIYRAISCYIKRHTKPQDISRIPKPIYPAATILPHPK